MNILQGALLFFLGYGLAIYSPILIHLKEVKEQVKINTKKITTVDEVNDKIIDRHRRITDVVNEHTTMLRKLKISKVIRLVVEEEK